MTSPRLAEHFFRHEHGKLVAVLLRRVGPRELEAVEDAVQSALLAALETWTRGGQPDNPSAWLYRVAYNMLVSELRTRGGRRRKLEQLAREAAEPPDGRETLLAAEVRDDLLRMLFVCCDDAIPEGSQVVLALKSLCGFSINEISSRLFASQESVYKRLARARDRLRALPEWPGELSREQMGTRLPALRKILYLIFTEGHLSCRAQLPIRRELVNEAIRLATILAEHPLGQTPETYALLALMHLHASRMSARDDGSGGLLLLEEQDRGQWDRRSIQTGLAWLTKSATGDRFSRYHAEAGIAAEHCLAPSFAETRWERVVQCYLLLEKTDPSPLHTLNRAVAVAEWHGPAAGLEIIQGIEPPTWLAGSYMWAAVLADLHRRCGDVEAAGRYRELALDGAPTPAVKELLARRLRLDGSGTGSDATS